MNTTQNYKYGYGRFYSEAYKKEVEEWREKMKQDDKRRAEHSRMARKFGDQVEYLLNNMKRGADEGYYKKIEFQVKELRKKQRHHECEARAKRV